METYIYLYVFFGISLLLVFTKLKELEYIVLGIWCVFFALFGGLRWYTGGDFQQGIDIFNNITWSNFYNYVEPAAVMPIEPFYAFLHVLVKTFTDKYHFVMLIICSSLQFTYFHISKRFSPQHPLILYALLIIGLRTMFPVRAGFAMVMVYWSYYFLNKHAMGKSVLFAVLAFCTHRMSLVLIIIYLVYYFRLRIKFWIAALLFVSFLVIGKVFQEYFILIATLMGGSIGERALMYTSFETAESSGAAYSIITILINAFYLVVFFYIRGKKQLESDPWYNTLLMMVIFVIGINCVFSDGMDDLRRLMDPLVPSLLILQAISFNHFWDKPKLKILARIFFVILMVKNMTSVLTVIQSDLYSNDCIPYETIFDYNIPLF